MSTSRRRRPVWVSDTLCDQYVRQRRAGVSIMAIQALKVFEGILANLVLAGLAWFLVSNGADPTIIGSLAIAVLAALNGISLSEYLAARQAIRETDLEVSDDE